MDSWLVSGSVEVFVLIAPESLQLLQKVNGYLQGYDVATSAGSSGHPSFEVFLKSWRSKHYDMPSTFFYLTNRVVENRGSSYSLVARRSGTTAKCCQQRFRAKSGLSILAGVWSGCSNFGNKIQRKRCHTQHRSSIWSCPIAASRCRIGFSCVGRLSCAPAAIIGAPVKLTEAYSS